MWKDNGSQCFVHSTLKEKDKTDIYVKSQFRASKPSNSSNNTNVKTFLWKADPGYYEELHQIIMVTTTVWIASIHSEQKVTSDKFHGNV